ncbi:MAG: hypothetical protein LKE33_09725 [Acidaminococcus sp.]|nr:hypothetical protein [Acidaminococcus sp.]MCI2117509.1 hypothetical protein [Acidaminococcus sp.]
MADKFKDNFRQISQVILGVVLVGFGPLLVEFTGLLGIVESSGFSDEAKVVIFALMPSENFFCWSVKFIVRLFLYLFLLYRWNSNYVLNTKNFYHDYPLWWYRVCRWLFGIKSCDLRNVPIYLQYKLVLNHVFEHYYINDELFPLDETLPKFTKPKELALSSNCREFNLVLEETYGIRVNQLPENKRDVPTIWLSVFSGRVIGRRYHSKLVDDVLEAVQQLPVGSRLNVFATTNPKTNLCIAQSASAMRGRSNLAKLFVYQQSSNQSRNFESEGHEIF